MKHLLTKLSLVVFIAVFTSGMMVAQSLSDLGKILGNGSQTEQTTTAPNDTTKQASLDVLGSALGGLLNSTLGGKTEQPTTTSNDTTKQASSDALGSALGGLLNGALGNNSSSSNSQSAEDPLASVLENVIGGIIAEVTEFTVANLEGNWVYVAPSCKFLSEDLLMSAGGDIAAVQLSEKLSPIYTKLGFTTETFGFTFDAEGAFTMTYAKIPLSGTATQTEEKGVFTLEFVKLGTKALATTPAHFEVVGDKMVVLFDADKFVALFRSVVSKLGITTLNTVFELVDNYDGVLVGFEMKKN